MDFLKNTTAATRGEMRTNRLIKAITLLLAIFVVAFMLRSFVPAYASPTQAAQEYWLRTGQHSAYQVENFEVLEIRPDCGCDLVLASFSANRAGETVETISYVRVDRGPFGWYATRGHSVSRSPLPDLVLYAIDHNLDDYEQLIYGQIFSPQVSAVEVSFEDGETRRDTADYGCFLMIAPDYHRFAELRLLGQDGSVLARYH
ncbi:MAG TPA: hypothetical protein VE136_12465 [Anaerolineales bacterium]|nr:hypothetical protein [Anaerolineales bacterium]